MEQLDKLPKKRVNIHLPHATGEYLEKRCAETGFTKGQYMVMLLEIEKTQRQTLDMVDLYKSQLKTGE